MTSGIYQAGRPAVNADSPVSTPSPLATYWPRSRRDQETHRGDPADGQNRGGKAPCACITGMKKIPTEAPILPAAVARPLPGGPQIGRELDRGNDVGGAVRPGVDAEIEDREPGEEQSALVLGRPEHDQEQARDHPGEAPDLQPQHARPVDQAIPTMKPTTRTTSSQSAPRSAWMSRDQNVFLAWPKPGGGQDDRREQSHAVEGDVHAEPRDRRKDRASDELLTEERGDRQRRRARAARRSPVPPAPRRAVRALRALSPVCRLCRASAGSRAAARAASRISSAGTTPITKSGRHASRLCVCTRAKPISAPATAPIA